MRNATKENILIIIILVTILTLLLVAFIFFIAYRYQQKQLTLLKGIEELKTIHENELLKSQLQVQEQTFQYISREIHDNIGQKLSLAKLHLNTLLLDEKDHIKGAIENVVQIISDSLNDLRDISRSMSSELIINNGLIKAIETEIVQINKIIQHSFKLIVTGDSRFMEAETELVLFRIVQEALNNIVKYAEATEVSISLHFTNSELQIDIKDNGLGFDNNGNSDGNGLINMKSRAASIKGSSSIVSEVGKGTTVTIKIPLYEPK